MTSRTANISLLLLQQMRQTETGSKVRNQNELWIIEGKLKQRETQQLEMHEKSLILMKTLLCFNENIIIEKLESGV